MSGGQDVSKNGDADETLAVVFAFSVSQLVDHRAEMMASSALVA